MTVHHKEFWRMHKEMLAWCARQEREGWQSPEVKHWANFVRFCLWSLAHNKDIHPGQLSALAEYTGKLEQARSAQH